MCPPNVCSVLSAMLVHSDGEAHQASSRANTHSMYWNYVYALKLKACVMLEIPLGGPLTTAQDSYHLQLCLNVSAWLRPHFFFCVGGPGCLAGMS